MGRLENFRYLWRDGSEPVRSAYAIVAKAILQFEPFYMAAEPSEPGPAVQAIYSLMRAAASAGASPD